METTAAYITHPHTRQATGDDLFCGCGRVLGYEVDVKWYQARRDRWRTSTYLVVYSHPSVKVYGRGEVSCTCGRKTVWDG